MKRQIFSFMALLLLVATVLTMSSCKKDTLTIKKQWMGLVDGEYTLIDISFTKDGYFIVPEQNEDWAKKYNLPKDTYFIDDVCIEIIEITSTSKTSGVIKVKGRKEGIDEIYYKDLTNNSVIFQQNNITISAKAVEKPITIREIF